MDAREAEEAFRFLLRAAQREPVGLAVEGRTVAVVVSMAEFARLQDSAERLARAKQAALRESLRVVDGGRSA